MRGSTGQPAREGLSLRDWRGTVMGGSLSSSLINLEVSIPQHRQLESFRSMIHESDRFRQSHRYLEPSGKSSLSRACFVILLDFGSGGSVSQYDLSHVPT